MTWALEYSPAALRELIEIPNWESAARVDEALMRFVETGHGDLRRMLLDGRLRHVLLVPPSAAEVRRIRTSRTMLVRRVVRYA